MKKTIVPFLALIGFLVLVRTGEARTVRADELNKESWSQFLDGKTPDLVVEFRQGDELPVSWNVQGGLLETSRPDSSRIRVRRNFWIKLENNDVKISWDGQSFRNLFKELMGSVSVGASADSQGGIANGLNVLLKVDPRP